MKTGIRMLMAMILIIGPLVLTSCGGDAETEKAIAGTWTTTFEDREDGVTIYSTYTETFYLPTHRFETEIKIRAGYPVDEQLCKMTYSGEWEASKEELIQKIDKNSVKFNFNNRVVDKEYRREVKKDILKEWEEQDYTEGMRFLGPIRDTFRATDDEGEHFTYKRVE